MADVDRDGDMDIITIKNVDNSDGIIWYENNEHHNLHGAKKKLLHTLGPGTAGPVNLLLEDLDGDGDLDIISTVRGDDYQTSEIHWYENDGAADPSWMEVDYYINPIGDGRGIQTADIDGDGDMDILSSYNGNINL